MYRRVLLPLDGCAEAEQALPHAIAQAKHLGAELILLKILKPLRTCGASRIAVGCAEKLTGDLAIDYLERVAADVRKHGVLVQVFTIEEEPHREILRWVRANRIDLIIIPARGRFGLGRWIVSSAADRVLQRIGVPVLTVQVKEKDMDIIESSASSDFLACGGGNRSAEEDPAPVLKARRSLREVLEIH
jgi:nucleotide-binding universal stress UspA family protein